MGSPPTLIILLFEGNEMSVRKQPNGKWYYDFGYEGKRYKRKVLRLNVKLRRLNL